MPPDQLECTIIAMQSPFLDHYVVYDRTYKKPRLRFSPKQHNLDTAERWIPILRGAIFFRDKSTGCN